MRIGQGMVRLFGFCIRAYRLHLTLSERTSIHEKTTITTPFSNTTHHVLYEMQVNHTVQRDVY